MRRPSRSMIYCSAASLRDIVVRSPWLTRSEYRSNRNPTFEPRHTEKPRIRVCLWCPEERLCWQELKSAPCDTATFLCYQGYLPVGSYFPLRSTKSLHHAVQRTLRFLAISPSAFHLLAVHFPPALSPCDIEDLLTSLLAAARFLQCLRFSRPLASVLILSRPVLPLGVRRTVLP